MAGGKRLVLTLDGAGRPAGLLEKRGEKGRFAPCAGFPAKGPARPCLLAAPPGLLPLRRAMLRADPQAGTQPDPSSAVLLDAQSSLAADPETGWSEALTLDGDGFRAAVLAWLGPEIPAGCSGELARLGLAPAGLLVPEFCWPDSRPALLCAADGDVLHVRYVWKGAPLAWESAFPGGPSPASCLEMIGRRLRDEGLPPPEEALLWTPGGADLDGPADLLARAFPGLRAERAEGWPDLLDRLLWPAAPLDLPFVSDRRPLFRGLARSGEFAAPDAGQWMSVILGAAGALLGAALLVLVVVNQKQQELHHLDKEVSRLKIQAARSVGAAQRIEALNAKIVLLRSATIGKPYLLAYLKDLADATPETAHVDSLDLTSDGTLAVQGRAKGEFSVVAFVENLNHSALWQDARIVSMHKDARTQELTFIVQAHAPKWKEYFKDRKDL